MVVAAGGAIALAACGGGGDDEASPDAATNGGGATPTAGAGTSGGTQQATAITTRGAASSPAGAGTCEGTVSGGVTASFRSGGSTSAVNSDYWFTDGELIQGARFLGETEEAVRAKIAAKQFVFYPLVLNCGDSKTGLNFLPNAEAHSDFPFGPKTYRIPPAGVLGGSAGAGEVSVLIAINDESYKSNGGTFEVKKFDKSGIAGTFSLEIEEAFATGTPKTGTVRGTFDMPCTGGNTRNGCSR